MSVLYEWVAEELTPGGEDIAETHAHRHCADVLHLFGHAARQRTALICLRRDRFLRDGELCDRQTAYLDELLVMPTEFDGGARIPPRYRDELACALAVLQINEETASNMQNSTSNLLGKE